MASPFWSLPRPEFFCPLAPSRLISFFSLKVLSHSRHAELKLRIAVIAVTREIVSIRLVRGSVVSITGWALAGNSRILRNSLWRIGYKGVGVILICHKFHLLVSLKHQNAHVDILPHPYDLVGPHRQPYTMFRTLR